MSFFPPQNDAPQKELIPAKTHEARCYGVIDLGTQERKPFQGKAKDPARALMIMFEFPDLMHKFKEDGPEEPRVKSLKFTYFTDDKSSLAKTIKSWLGKTVKEVDFARLAGTPASITITHDVSESNGKTYDNVSSIAPVSDKLIPLIPAQINPTLNFSIMEHGFDSPEYKAVYEWIRKIIEESVEYKDYLSGPAKGQNPPDVPFN